MRMDGLERRMDGLEKRMDALETALSDLRREMRVLHEEVLDRIEAADPTPALRREMQAAYAGIKRDLSDYMERTSDIHRYLVGLVNGHEVRIQRLEQRPH
jgi:hypothetical protein